LLPIHPKKWLKLHGAIGRNHAVAKNDHFVCYSLKNVIIQRFLKNDADLIT